MTNKRTFCNACNKIIRRKKLCVHLKTRNKIISHTPGIKTRKEDINPSNMDIDTRISLVRARLGERKFHKLLIQPMTGKRYVQPRNGVRPYPMF